MKRSTLAPIGAAIGIVVCVAAAPAFAKDTVYGNARYGYTVAYPPDLFKAQPESGNGDGRAFTSRDGSTEFRVWADYAAASEPPAQLASMAEQDCARKPAGYRVVKPTLVAVSCTTADGKVFYEKLLIHGGLTTAFEMTYPVAQKTKWDAVLSRISASLRAGRP